MPQKLRTSPRKMPTQARSKDTVEAILRATARVLVTEGYDRASTNKIANRAGVSVGSLYQYFPSKESLVAALIEEHTSQMMAVLEQKLALVESVPPDVAVRELIRGMVEAHQIEPRLHAVITEQIPKLGGLRQVFEMNRVAGRLIRVRLEALREFVVPKKLDVAVFILVAAFEAVTHAFVIDQPEGVTLEDLVEELSALVLRYLFGPLGA